MSNDEPRPDNETPQPDATETGARNIERLLREAYRPETPDAAFARNVEARMREAVSAQAQPRPVATPGRPSFRLSPTWLALGAAALLALVVGLGFRSTHPDLYRSGEIVYIDGNPYYPAPSAVPGQTHWTPVPIDVANNSNTPPAPALPYQGLGAKPRPAAPEAKPIAVGDQIATKAGERRRVTLPDGSVLFVNEKTTLKLARPRLVELQQGEVYAEVAPRAPNTPGPEFYIVTPHGTVQALGTKFRTALTEKGAETSVVEGRVQVIDIRLAQISGSTADVAAARTNLSAGQRLLFASGANFTGLTPSPAPRSTYTLEWTKDLMAAAESPLVPASNYAGGALIALDPFGQEIKLALRKFHVDVHIEDGFARTTIDQTYFNTENWRLEGTFYFPLPPDASLSRLAMYVDGKLMEGGMAERDHARNVYEQIVTRRKDPALLEWVDGSTFKMRVFPLEGRQEKRIVLGYTQRLPTLYGRAQYRFPVGHNLALIRDWSVHVRAKDAANLLWNSDSDTFVASKDGADLVLDAEAHHVKPDRDVVVNLFDNDLAAQETDAARFATCKHENLRYLMLRYRPQLAGLAQRERRDWVFLYERSGDRDPLTARAQVEIVKTMLEHAERNDTFAIVTAGTGVESFAQQPLPATPDNVTKALAWLERAHLVGALDLGQAFAAAEPFVKAGQNVHLVHVGSGVAVLGEKREDVLAKQLPAGARYIGVGVGKRWARGFMKNAAALTGGCFTQINPDEQIRWRAFDLLSTLNAPRLLNLRVVDNAEKIRFLTTEESLAQGEELCAIAQIPNNAGLPNELTVTGLLNGKPFRKTLAVAKADDGAGYLPRTWAKLEIDRLLAEDAEKNKDAVVNLSKAMYVMSPFTSLLVLENEEMYRQFNVDRGRKDHWAMYACPEKIPVVFEPDPRWNGGVANAPKADEVKKPTEEQVLGTIMVRMAPEVIRWPNEPYYGGYQSVTAYQYLSGAYAVPYRYGWHDYYRREGNRRMNDWTRASGLVVGNETEGLLASGQLGDRWETDGPVDMDGRFGQRLDLLKAVGSSRGRKDRLMPMKEMSAAAPIPGFHKVLADRKPGMPASGPMASSRLSLRDEKSMAFKGRTRSRRNVAFDYDEEAGGATVDGYLERIASGYRYQQLYYQRPQFNGDQRVFSDLLAYAPGLNTSYADIQAVVEAEAQPNPRSAPGQVDPKAQALIEKARAAGWQRLEIPAEEGQDGFAILFDGAGRYTYERVLPEGLREQVICDGETILHLYAEIGLAAKRSASRFHRTELTELIPWALPKAEDLAHGADVNIVDERTVAIVPRGAAAAKDADGKPLPYHVSQLIFADDGRLVERRWIEMPSGKLLAKETYRDGAIKRLDAEGKAVFERTGKLAAAQAPDLKPATKDLVVLPMPFRTREVAFKKNPQNNQYGNWSEEDALGLLASAVAQNNWWEIIQVIGQRFPDKSDRKIGFYTLLLAGQNSWDLKQEFDLGNNRKMQFSPVADHPGTTLARYVARQLELNQGQNRDKEEPAYGGTGLLAQLGTFRELWWRWQQGHVNRGSQAEQKAEREKALDFVRTCRSPAFGWAILSFIQNYGGDQAFYQAVGEASKAFEKYPELAYAARYENARGLQNAGKPREARALFEALFEDSLKKGILPRIDHSFRQAFQQDSDGQERWGTVMRKAAKKLVDEKHRVQSIELAWQCQQLGDQPLADELLLNALSAVTPEERLPVTLAGVEYLWATGQLPRAEALLEPILADEKFSKNASLWHLAAQLAAQRGMLARSLSCLEKAMDLEFADLPDVINLQTVRQEYGALMGQYQQLANAVSTLQTQAPAEFVARVIRMADRWRALDDDDTLACQAAARVLQRLGANALAWEYLTTPVAQKPNEAQPWLNLAQTFRGDGEYELADKAYVAAFAAEATNAQILWDRAQNLIQASRVPEARRVYEQLAAGEWQPRFQGLKEQAKRFLEQR